MFGLFMPFLGSMARHALTLVAGYLVTAGLLPAAQANGFVGACLLFVGIGWSLWNKLNRPEVLAKLQARQAVQHVQAKEAAAAQFSKVFGAAGAAMATFAILLALAPSPAAAQWIWSSPAAQSSKPKVKKVAGRPTIITVEPSKAGLSDLIGGVTGGMSPLDQLFAGLQKASLDDLQYAKALADGVKDNKGAAARSACYAAWIGMLATVTSAQAATEGTALQAPGSLKPHLFTRFEQLSQVADNLAPLSDFQRACAPVASAMKLNISQFVLAVVGGGLSLGKLGVLP